jgi:hypothetical protein
MIRSALSTGLRSQHAVVFAAARRAAIPNNQHRALSKLTSLSSSRQLIGYRFLSSSDKPPKGEKKEDDANEIMLTPGEQVVAASRLTMWAGIGVFALVCAFYIGKELIPT